jgi:hypothetical protein
MKSKSNSQSGFFNLRILLAAFCLAGVLIALVGAGLYLGSSEAQAQSGAGSAAAQAESPSTPHFCDVLQH